MPSSPAQFYASVSTVAAAQICGSVGFRRAQPGAVRLLSDLLGRYLCSLAAIASDGANSDGRTDCNLFDLVRALEVIHGPRGFSGAACLGQSLLQSAVLRDVLQFVSLVDEIPFAVPLPRVAAGESSRMLDTAIFAEKNAPHVPRWLPIHPQRKDDEALNSRREALWPVKVDIPSGNERAADGPRSSGGILPKKRVRVRFRMGAVKDNGGKEEASLERREKDMSTWECSRLGVVRKLPRWDERVCAPLPLLLEHADA